MKRGKPIQLVLILLVVFMILLNGMFTVSAGHAADKTLLMATTTSTDNTGLLEYLMPFFTAKTGIGIRWISGGTGKALKLGENCDVDALLVAAEDFLRLPVFDLEHQDADIPTEGDEVGLAVIDLLVVPDVVVVIEPLFE